MPKRHGQLYEQLTEEALYDAYLAARRGKRAMPSTIAFESDLGANLSQLAAELRNGTYDISPYRRFYVHEPKTREISAPAFRDRIVQHAIYALIYPIFDATFIHDSYGCRVGKGTHRAADQAQRYLRAAPPESVNLQIDIRKFYYSIDRRKLRELVERKIKDACMVALMMRFAESDEPAGLPIGNLLSQLYALVYLDAFDHWIKREQRIKRYVRYVDDSIMFGLTRAQAYALLAEIRVWLAENLGLALSRYTIAPSNRGVNFVGFRIWCRTRFVRKHSLRSFSRALRSGNLESLNAIMANARHTATLGHFRRRILTERPALAPMLAHM